MHAIAVPRYFRVTAQHYRAALPEASCAAPHVTPFRPITSRAVDTYDHSYRRLHVSRRDVLFYSVQTVGLGGLQHNAVMLGWPSEWQRSGDNPSFKLFIGKWSTLVAISVGIGSKLTFSTNLFYHS